MVAWCEHPYKSLNHVVEVFAAVWDNERKNQINLWPNRFCAFSYVLLAAGAYAQNKKALSLWAFEITRSKKITSSDSEDCIYVAQLQPRVGEKAWKMKKENIFYNRLKLCSGYFSFFLSWKPQRDKAIQEIFCVNRLKIKIRFLMIWKC